MKTRATFCNILIKFLTYGKHFFKRFFSMQQYEICTTFEEFVGTDCLVSQLMSGQVGHALSHVWNKNVAALTK